MRWGEDAGALGAGVGCWGLARHLRPTAVEGSNTADTWEGNMRLEKAKRNYALVKNVAPSSVSDDMVGLPGQVFQ